ncbi:MAG: cardiolipin synthase [Thermoguttaceae bacterium]|nr:cardiolipin synthase [Thermoguttaceae bacterium]MDW8039629.1 cardiolipin synthase [Thermoguttaceae bacterium]
MSLLFWTKLVLISEWVIRLVMLLVIVIRKQKPPAALAWLAIIFFEPWIGLVLYLLLGEIRLGRRRLALRRRRRGEFASSEYPELGPGAVPSEAGSPSEAMLLKLSQQLEQLPVVRGNAIEFFIDPDRAIEQLVADIDQAQDHVHLLFYIYGDDWVGRQVGEALIRARQRGVICRLLADAIGSRKFFRRLARWLQTEGIEVYPALPATLWRLPFARLDIRNHRKLAIIDGRIAYTGSQNIIEPTYGHRRGGPWHDIMARLTGPVVWQLQTVFLEDWFHETGQLLESTGLFPCLEPTGEVMIQVVPTGPDLPTEQFQDLVARTLFMAEKQIVITCPYFVPDDAMLVALRIAAQGGVRVLLVVPRWTDHPLVDAAGMFYLEYLHRFGAEVYFYQPGLLHSKTLTIDDRLAMFGSANYDIRSFELNFELNLLLHSPAAVGELYRLQQYYWQQSRPATADDWPKPISLRGLKVHFAKLLSPLL